MEAFLAYMVANKALFVALIPAVVGVASIIVKLTPTPKDDAFLAKVIAVLEKFALNPKKE